MRLAGEKREVIPFSAYKKRRLKPQGGQALKRYNFVRPLMLIITALLVKSIVTNGSMLLGMAPEPAANVGFMAMILAAFIMYTRMAKRRKK